MSRQKKKGHGKIDNPETFETEEGFRAEGYFPGIDTPAFFHYTPSPEIELISVLNL